VAFDGSLVGQAERGEPRRSSFFSCLYPFSGRIAFIRYRIVFHFTSDRFSRADRMVLQMSMDTGILKPQDGRPARPHPTSDTFPCPDTGAGGQPPNDACIRRDDSPKFFTASR
jgi:hypothetical protein